MLRILNHLLIIFLFLTIHQTNNFASEIVKYENKDGNHSYTNIETNKDGLKNIEVIETTTTSKLQHSPEINYQIENLFNDRNTGTKLLSTLQSNRNDLNQLLINYGQQLEEAQFELNANTVTLDRCYINPVYDYLILFCSGLELKQQRLLNELDLISNSIDNIRAQVIALDLQINDINSQNKSEVCTVKEVLTGESFVCAFGNGLSPVKLIGVETPEKTKEFLETILPGKRVLLRFDENKSDLNNNLLAYVFIDDTTMLNALLLRQGMALALSNYEYKYIYEFNEYEKLAKESNAGIWSN